MPALGACGAADEHEIGMMLPTYVTCLEVGQYADPAAVLAAAPERDLTMFTPSLDPDDRLSIPARSRPLWEARGG
jgi:hypothetical protein